MTILCSVKNINVAFGQKHIFNNASFQIEHGDKIGLIGLNGMGKSTLFKILNSSLTPDTSTPPFTFDKATAKQGANLEYSVFLVPQKFVIPDEKKHGEFSVRNYYLFYYEEMNKLNKMLAKIDEQLANDYTNEELTNKRYEISDKLDHMGYYEITHQYENYLKAFDLNDLDANVKDLSGGEQRKILLAIGLTQKANLILWDEPTNHLDIATINIFEEEIIKSTSTHVIISHDRFLLSKCTNKIFHINRGQILSYKGTYADYMEFVASEEHARKQMLSKLKNSLTRELAWMRQGVRARGTKSKKRIEGFHDLSQKVSDLKSDAKKSMDILINSSNRKTKKLCEFIDVNFSYNANKPIFNNLNFSLYKNDKIGVLGGNGVGKSTLMKIIAKQLEITSGQIKFADDLKTCYFSQLRDDLPLDKTPFEILGEGEDFVHFKSGRSIHVASYFQNYLFNQTELYRPLSSFSGGEINRLQLALNLKNEADIWIFDEPTNDLDIESIEILEDKLSKFEGTVLIISHDRIFLENVTNKIWYVENNNITHFDVGYSQVAPYLEACEIEAELLKEQAQITKEKNSSNSPQNSVKQKLTAKEEAYLDELPLIILEIEEGIAKIDDLLAKFDYSKLDAEQTKLIAALNQKKSKSESELIDLYEQLDKLEKRL